MCKLLLEAGFATPHPSGGIVLINMQYLTDKLCDEKCTGRKGRVKPERWVRIKIKQLTLRSIHTEFSTELFKQKINQIRYRVMSDYVNRSREPKGNLKLKFAELHTHYDTSLIKLSNKTLGKYFNRSRSFARKVKQAVKQFFSFAYKNINLGTFTHHKYESGYMKKRYALLKPTFLLKGEYPVKNMGQRMLIM